MEYVTEIPDSPLKKAVDGGGCRWYSLYRPLVGMRGITMSRNKYPEETVHAILEAAMHLFAQKGYDGTSMQDIMDKTGLSKGAIYHHFSSKMQIFETICDQLSRENVQALAQVVRDPHMSAPQKMKAMFRTALANPNQDFFISTSPSLLKNPRFLAAQVNELYTIVAPDFVQPILQQGMEEGSIPVENPKELAEAIMVLTNLWLNPLVHETDEAGTRRRCQTFCSMMQGIGIDLMDDELVERYVGYCSLRDKLPPSQQPAE